MGTSITTYPTFALSTTCTLAGACCYLCLKRAGWRQDKCLLSLLPNFLPAWAGRQITRTPWLRRRNGPFKTGACLGAGRHWRVPACAHWEQTHSLHGQQHGFLPSMPLLPAFYFLAHFLPVPYLPLLSPLHSSCSSHSPTFCLLAHHHGMQTWLGTAWHACTCLPLSLSLTYSLLLYLPPHPVSCKMGHFLFRSMPAFFLSPTLSHTRGRPTCPREAAGRAVLSLSPAHALVCGTLNRLGFRKGNCFAFGLWMLDWTPLPSRLLHAHAPSPIDRGEGFLFSFLCPHGLLLSHRQTPSLLLPPSPACLHLVFLPPLACFLLFPCLETSPSHL